MAPGLGKLASVVVLRAGGGAPLAQGPPSSSGGGGGDALAAAGEGLAMHVAGMRPAYLQRSAVPPEALERERALLAAQMQQDAAFKGKPQQVLAKVVEGRLSKALSDWCLAEQRYVLDDSLSVQQMMARCGPCAPSTPSLYGCDGGGGGGPEPRAMLAPLPPEPCGPGCWGGGGGGGGAGA
ncbi:Elongation factor Ts, partial [Tetrabaena socialis]